VYPPVPFGTNVADEPFTSCTVTIPEANVRYML
jgi:hypothetical protein